MTGLPPAPAGYRGGRALLLTALLVLGAAAILGAVTSAMAADYRDWAAELIESARGAMLS
ncbi:hypothetical protein AB0B66_09150 [Catellatospora sp. NPDC049111]|uniref:hypothetical protein n=1 Tax=Catellatospora sp. NPDC049111 TaxID=3155271 RepID=UPI0033EC340B